MSMSGKKCQSEVRAVFEKLTSWREDSHRQFSDIIKSHSSSISEGINDLVEEVSELKTEISVIRKERNVLLEAVDNLNGEIRQLTKFPITGPLSEGNENVGHQIREEDGSELGAPIKVEQDLERPEIHIETGNEEMCLDNGDISHPNVLEQNKNTSNDLDHLKNSPNNEVTEIDDKKNEGIQADNDLYDISVDGEIETIESKTGDSVCPECNFLFSTNENMRIHMENVHPNLDVSKISLGSNEDLKKKSNHLKDNILAQQQITLDHTLQHQRHKEAREKLKCEQCPYETSVRENMIRHINGVHEKIKDHICEECGYATSQKNNLKVHKEKVHFGVKKIKTITCDHCSFAADYNSDMKRHIDAVHKKIRRHVCEECDYATSVNYNLKMHKASVHKMGGRKYKCEKCPYSSSRNDFVKRHVKGVHDKIRNHSCEECTYAASTKAHLKYHKVSVHKMGEKNHKCEKCPYKTQHIAHLKMHIKRRHDKIRSKGASINDVRA